MLNCKLRLTNTIIPIVPFLWYREKEIMCPIEYIGICNKEKLDIQVVDDVYLIIQRHVLENENIYICLHSLLYYFLNSSIIKEGIVKKIPTNYKINKNFDVKLVQINSDIQTLPNGLKVDKYITGSVFIHDSAFSPMGCLHFKINEDKDVHTILMYIKSNELGIYEPIKCLFVLFNDTKNKKLDDEIKNIMNFMI